MADIAWDNLIKGILVLVVSPFIVTGVIRISREWGVRGGKINACIEGLEVLVGKMDKFMSSVSSDHAEIKSHLQQQRSDLRETHAALETTACIADETRDAVRNMADLVNPRLAKIEFILCGPDGENGLRRDVRDVRDRVVLIEQRVGPPDRRRTVRVVKDDRRKKA